MRIGVVSVIKESWGGSEELWAAMAHEAIAQGHEVIVSAYDCEGVHPKMQALIDKGLKLIYRRGYVTPGLPQAKRIFGKLQIVVLNKLSNPFKSFISNKPDCVLYNGTSYTSVEDRILFTTLIQQQTRYYYLAHIAADYYRPVGLPDLPVIINAFQHASKNFFIAEKTIQITERQLAASIPNAIVVRNPVNLEKTVASDYPAITGVIQFAMVGLLVVAHKGQDMTLEVLSNEEWKNRSWHLNIYGSGVDELFLKRLTTFYSLDKKVTFHGKVNDIRSVWQKNHLLLMTSLMEGMPLAVVEAMICGRPSLVTDVGGHTEWIEDNKDGFVADAPSVSSIRKTLERAWHQKENWQVMGESAREKALSLYNPEPGKTLLNLLMNE
jgi:glycosyltransferase involved in cell wall biosynthesis